MKILFWIALIFDIGIIYYFSSTLMNMHLKGIIATKSKADMNGFILQFIVSVILTGAPGIFYYYKWYKTAILLASIPFSWILFLLLIPIIAYMSGQKINQ